MTLATERPPMLSGIAVRAVGRCSTAFDNPTVVCECRILTKVVDVAADSLESDTCSETLGGIRPECISMAVVRFTKNLQRHIELPPQEVAGGTVREVLDVVFTTNGRARDYVLDNQGALRKHMMVFVDGRLIQDRVGLSDAVPADGTVDVMQALSGG